MFTHNGSISLRGKSVYLKNVLVLLIVFCCFCCASADELLDNGDFSGGSSNWNIYDGGVWNAYSSNALKVWATDGLWDVGFAYQEVSVIAGETYAMTVDVLNPAAEPLPGGGGAAFIKFDFYDDTETLINGPYGTPLGIIDGTLPTDTWYSISGSMTAPAGAVKLYVILMVQDTGGGPSVVWFDNASLIGPDIQTFSSPDYDQSLRVDLADYAKLARVWGQQSTMYNLAGSEQIDIDDLAVMAEAWLDSPVVYPGYTLVWSDEFYGSQINSDNWTHETGTGSDGWGNWEWQYYTERSENSRIEDGKLVIEARKENYGGMKYTSARLKTQGKQSFKYGRIEARIKLPPGGNGIWPAFWMLGENITTVHWPQCGEIDIMEMMESPYSTSGTIHYGSSEPYIHDSDSKNFSSGTNLSEGFHVFRIEWDETQIRWYRDGYNFHNSSNSWAGTGAEQEGYPAPFDKDFFLILNFAVGSWWMTEDPDLTFPQKMYVDYVRVYQKTSP